MNRTFKEVINEGLKIGFEEVEIYYSATEKMDISVFEGRVDKFSRSRIKGIAVRGVKNGKTGFAFTEDTSIKALKNAIGNAYENMNYIDCDDVCRILGSSGPYGEPEISGDSFAKTDIDTKIRMLLDMEKYIFNACDRVHKISHLGYVEFKNEEKIVNSFDLDLSDSKTQAYIYVDVIVKDGDRFRSGEAYKAAMEFGEFVPEDVAKKALDDALSKTGAGSINTGDYRTVFRNTAFADLLSVFSGIFTADKVQKGMSKLTGMIGKTIGSGKLTITDDPCLQGGLANARFDGEGVRTRKKDVVSEGELKTYLYNIKTAIKDGTGSTGNAGRQSYRSGIGTDVFNFYIKPGEGSLDEGIKSMDRGIVITELQGLHAGVDPISCDFSLSAQGFKVENGTVSSPVCDITVSGNFLEILKNIKDVYNDLEFSLPSGGNFGSPSIYVGDVSIAGEKGAL